MPVYHGNLLNLLKRLKDANAPPDAIQATTATMLHQMLLALDHVHTQGIIHRDIKPANILYRGDDFFLTNFGIAKVMDSSRIMAGTRWYTAPEVQSNGDQTPKVDIYSLSVILSRCYRFGVFGRTPTRSNETAMAQVVPICTGNAEQA
jgi:serine/threonine protein kinase